MIEIKDKTFHILTDNTSYIFSITDAGYPEHIYYGQRLRNPFFSLDAIREKHMSSSRMALSPYRKERDFSLNESMLEFSTEGKGDYKVPSFIIFHGEEGERTINFTYTGYDTKPGFLRMEEGSLPQAICPETECDTLSVYYEDKRAKIKLTQVYTTFNSTDTITRRNIITNLGKGLISIDKIASMQFDIRETGFDIYTLQGAWGRERHLTKEQISGGTYSMESLHLMTSAEMNPGFVLQKGNDTYLFNLVYSGSFRNTVSVNEHGITHVVVGINENQFDWTLMRDDSFESPEAVLSYSPNGLYGIQKLSHRFIEKHIKRGLWKDRLRPLMFSSWGGYKYELSEKKVEEIIKFSKEVGFEGVLIEDGWFAARNNEKSSLGDWFANSMRFPSGLQLLASETHRENLLFGLWIAPEVVSERSNLYKKHPEWVIGRNLEENAINNTAEQLLDLTRKDVQDWIISTVGDLIELEKVDYIRWDCTRYASDFYSNKEINDYGEFMHRYELGLYRILKTITQRYPNLYLEMGSSGGSRFDLGMIAYSASLTSSKIADPIERIKTFEGTSLLYPLSVIGASITPTPDSDTGRIVSNATKFNIDAFGVLEYSVFVDRSYRSQVEEFKRQVAFYITHRAIFQYGDLRIEETGDRTIWSVSSPDKSIVIVLYVQKLFKVNTSAETLKINNINANYNYLFSARAHYQTEIELSTTPQEPESYYVSGQAVKYAGIKLVENISGNGYKFGMRTLGDFSSRLYIFRRVK